MENQTNQVRRRNLLPIILLVAAGIFVLICGLLAIGIFYKYGSAYFGPQAKIVLEPDYALVQSVDSADLEKAVEILNARSRTLGSGLRFVVANNNQITAQGPAAGFTENLIGDVVHVGLLEFVDFGETSIPLGTTITTDFDYKYAPKTEGTTWHTILTNAEFDLAHVSQDQFGRYQVLFALTDEGKKVLSEYTASNVGHYLGIVIDKVVLSSPKVSSPITDGQGAISGSFTKEEAESLAVYLQVQGPLPIPLVVKEISEIDQ